MATESLIMDMDMAEMIECDTYRAYYLTIPLPTTECNLCYSLQPCICDGEAYICADAPACLKRQAENKQDRPQLTPADYAGLLDRMETQQADMQRLKVIEAAALVFVQALEAFRSRRGGGHGALAIAHDDFLQAEKNLMRVVKR